MKRQVATKKKPAQAPFAKRMATIVFEANIQPKGNAKPMVGVSELALSAADLDTYTKLSLHFLLAGGSIVSKSAQDIADIMPPEVFMEALPRLTKAGAITVTFWEHAASTPKFWRKVKSF